MVSTLTAQILMPAMLLLLSRFCSREHTAFLSKVGLNAKIGKLTMASTPLCVTVPAEVLNFSIRTKGMAISQVMIFQVYAHRNPNL